MVIIKDTLYIKRKALRIASKRFMVSLEKSLMGNFFHYCVISLNNFLNHKP